MSAVAHCTMEIYALENALLRALKLVERQDEAKTALVRVAAVEAMLRIDGRLKEGTAAIAAHLIEQERYSI